MRNVSGTQNESLSVWGADFSAGKNFGDAAQTFDWTANKTAVTDAGYSIAGMVAPDGLDRPVEDGMWSLALASEEAADAYTPGTILTNTLWNQSGVIYISVNGVQTALTGTEYNQYCPYYLANGVRAAQSVTGCTNTADSQVVYYWLQKGYTFDFEVALSDYFIVQDVLTGGEVTVSMSNAGNYGAASAETVNSILAQNAYTTGNFIAALNYYCGIKNNSIYGDSTATLYWLCDDATGDYNGRLFKALNFDSHNYIYRSNSLFFASSGESSYLTEFGYSIVRECLDYGEVVRVEIPGHSIYLDGYRYNSGSEQYEYHLNYGWGTSAGNYTKWYTTNELIAVSIREVGLDVTPHVAVTVSSYSSDYAAGTMARGLERINHVLNDTATTVTFTSATANRSVTLNSAWKITSLVDVEFTNFNISLIVNAASAIESTQKMSFNDVTGNLLLNYNGAGVVVGNTGNEALSVTLNGGGVFAGYRSNGAAIVVSVLNNFSKNGFASLAGVLDNVVSTAFQSGAGADRLVLNDQSVVLGDFDLGTGSNRVTIESGSVWYGDLASKAAFQLVLNDIFEDAMIVVKSDLAALCAKGSFTVAADTAAGGNYALIDASRLESAAELEALDVVVTSGGQSATLNLSGVAACDFAQLYTAGGRLYVQTGVVGSGAVMIYSSGVLTASEDQFSGVALGSGGDNLMTVGSGGMAALTEIHAGGRMEVYEDGAAAQTVVDAGGELRVSGGNVTSSLISGALNMFGGAVSSTTVADGGRMVVAGGSAIAAELVGATAEMVVSGGRATSVSVSGTARVETANGGWVEELTLHDSGAGEVLSGGVAQSVVIFDHGQLNVQSGGQVLGGVVAGVENRLGGDLKIQNGGVVVGVTVGLYGDMYVLRGGRAVNCEIASEGRTMLSSGAVAENTKLGNGGTLYVSGGAVATGTTELAGGARALVSSGGRVGGSLMLADGAEFSFASGGMLDFDISARSTTDAALVNRLALVTGAPSYTITVSETQSAGEYALASGVESFSSTVTVQTAAGRSLGVVTTAASLTVDNVVYELDLTDGALSLEVTVGPKSPGAYFAGNFAGGATDLLAVVRDNQISICKDGAVWSSLSVGDGWTVVGAGDFNGDGVDDLLRKYSSGLVAADLSDGDGGFSESVLNATAPGWSVLGLGNFSSGAADDVLVANPAGASDSVGLIGYWAGGTEWTVLNGYDPSWKMVAVGDYNGDGTDDMLWKNSFTGDDGNGYDAFCTWLTGVEDGWRLAGVTRQGTWSFLGSGDFDGDGTADIAMIDAAGVTGIWQITGGVQSDWSILNAADVTAWHFAGVGDYNGDGTDDIAWANPDVGFTGYWQVKDRQTASWQAIGQVA